MSPLHPGLLAIALCTFALVCPANTVAQNGDPGLAQQTNSDGGATRGSVVEELPDSPGAIWAKSQAPEQGPAAQSTSTPADPQAPDKKPDTKKDEKLQRPVGTAAAEAPKVSGVTAAQPTGAAIAPAKQHRVRTIVLKVGAILGASAAVGTVVALSAATPSRPPGAH